MEAPTLSGYCLLSLSLSDTTTGALVLGDEAARIESPSLDDVTIGEPAPLLGLEIESTVMADVGVEAASQWPPCKIF